MDKILFGSKSDTVSGIFPSAILPNSPFSITDRFSSTSFGNNGVQENNDTSIINEILGIEQPSTEETQEYDQVKSMLIRMNIVENGRYTRASMKRVFSDVVQYPIYPKELYDLIDIFYNIYESSDYKKIDMYIDYLQSLNTEEIKLSSEDDRQEMHDAREILFSERKRLLSEGLVIENVQALKEAQDWVKEVSKEFEKVFLESRIVKNWDSPNVARMLISCLYAADYVEIPSINRIFQPDDNGDIVYRDSIGVEYFQQITSSILFNVMCKIFENRTEREINEVMSLIRKYSNANIKSYAVCSQLSEFFETGSCFRLLKSTASWLEYSYDAYKYFFKLKNYTDHLKNTSVYKDHYIKYDLADLPKMPVGSFLIMIDSDTHSDIEKTIFKFNGSVKDSELIVYNEAIPNEAYESDNSFINDIFGGSVVYHSCYGFLLSQIDTLFVCANDRFAVKDEYDFVGTLLEVSKDIKYKLLKLLNNIDDLFPGIFNNIADFDILGISIIEEDNSLLMLVPQEFVSRKQDSMLVVKDQVVSKKSSYVKGDIVSQENGNLVLKFDLPLFKYNIDIDLIDNESFVTELESDEREKAKEDKTYWAKIFKLLGERTRFTYEEVYKIVENICEFKCNKSGGRGSHYKLSSDERFTIVSKKKRESGFYINDLKEILKSLKISFKDAYEALQENYD